MSDLYFQMLHLEHVMDFTQQTYDGLYRQKRISAMVEQGLVNPLIFKIESGLLDIEQGQRKPSWSLYCFKIK